MADRYHSLVAAIHGEVIADLINGYETDLGGPSQIKGLLEGYDPLPPAPPELTEARALADARVADLAERPLALDPEYREVLEAELLGENPGTRGLAAADWLATFGDPLEGALSLCDPEGELALADEVPEIDIDELEP